MTDIVTPETRSRMMSRIRGKNTRPELAIRTALHRKGLRYRLNVRGLPGSPDMVFPKWNAVLFVHGCYWHRHPGCSKATMPASNTRFWMRKFEENTARDARNVQGLLAADWRVGIVWECAIGRNPSERLVSEIVAFLTVSEKSHCEFG